MLLLTLGYAKVVQDIVDQRHRARHYSTPLSMGWLRSNPSVMGFLLSELTFSPFFELKTKRSVLFPS